MAFSCSWGENWQKLKENNTQINGQEMEEVITGQDWDPECEWKHRDKDSPVLITGELHLLQPVPVSLTTIMSGQSGAF